MEIKWKIDQISKPSQKAGQEKKRNGNKMKYKNLMLEKVSRNEFGISY